MADIDNRPIVCVDMNGVLDCYTGWKDADHWDEPRAGAGEFLRQLGAAGYRVVVFTTRYADDVRAWLVAHGLAEYVDEVTDRKPPAHVFVDDRAVCFTGDYAATLRAISRFTAHWESEHAPPQPDLKVRLNEEARGPVVTGRPEGRLKSASTKKGS